MNNKGGKALIHIDVLQPHYIRNNLYKYHTNYYKDQHALMV